MTQRQRTGRVKGGEKDMKRIVIITMIMCTTVGLAIGEDKGVTNTKTIRFTMPPDKALDMSKTIKCAAIASATIYEQRIDIEDFKKPKLTAKVAEGTDKLRLWLDGDDLTVQVKDEKSDTYKVTGYNAGGGWLVAQHYGGLVPTAYAISLNTRNGFGVWSLNEPMLVLGSLYPFGEIVYLYCAN